MQRIRVPKNVGEIEVKPTALLRNNLPCFSGVGSVG
jgi:hypothetical protein